MKTKGPWGGMTDAQLAQHFKECRALGADGMKQRYWHVKETRGDGVAERTKRDLARMATICGGY